MPQSFIHYYGTHSYLWYGLPLPLLVTLFIPLYVLFFLTLRQHFSEKYWRFSDRQKALEHALSNLRPPSRSLNFFRQYLVTIAIIDVILALFSIIQGTSFFEVVTPPHALIWLITLAIAFFMKIAKTSLQDKMKGHYVTWSKLTLNTCLAELSDYLVLRFLAKHDTCEETFEKIFIFPEPPEGSVECKWLGPIFFDPLHINGIFLTKDTSIFLLEEKSHLVLHTKNTLRNLLAAEFAAPEKDEGLLESVPALPFSSLAENIEGPNWDCLKVVLATDDESSDELHQYTKSPGSPEHIMDRIPLFKGELTNELAINELFPVEVTKMTLTGSSLQLSWRGDQGNPLVIPIYASESSDTLLTRLQNRVRRHKRILLTEASWENARNQLRQTLVEPEEEVIIDPTPTLDTTPELSETTELEPIETLPENNEDNNAASTPTPDNEAVSQSEESSSADSPDSTQTSPEPTETLIDLTKSDEPDEDTNAAASEPSPADTNAEKSDDSVDLTKKEPVPS